MSQWKEAFSDTFVYQTARCFDEGNEKETEVKMYIYIHSSYQNLPCMDWAKTESILTILKISVKRKLYSKFISKNYFDYFSPHTYLSKNQKVIISWNRDFCNFKLKFSAKWHWKANHWSNINKWKGLVCWMIGLFWFFWFCIFKRCEL